MHKKSEGKLISSRNVGGKVVQGGEVSVVVKTKLKFARVSLPLDGGAGGDVAGGRDTWTLTRRGILCTVARKE